MVVEEDLKKFEVNIGLFKDFKIRSMIQQDDQRSAAWQTL